MIVYRVAQSNLRQKCTTDSNINDHFQFRFEDYRAYGTQLRTYFLPADYTDFWHSNYDFCSFLWIMN